MIRLLVIAVLLVSTSSVFGQAWKARESWPDDFPRPPKSAERLFYLQRNLNKNTISYDLNIDSNGHLDTGEPLEVYWMRYSGGRDGVKEETSWLQRKFAFGYGSSKGDNDDFYIKLVAYNKRPIHLQKLNGTWVAVMKIDGRNCRLNNIYVYADESGMMPDVKHVDLYGIDLETGNAVKERFYND